MKRKRIKVCLFKGKENLCFIQESKLKDTTGGVVRSLWGSNEVDWMAKNFIGLSGGMLIMWKKIISSVFIFIRNGYLGICATFKGTIYYFVKVYS